MSTGWPDPKQYEAPLVARTWAERWPLTLLEEGERNLFPPGRPEGLAAGAVGTTPGLRLLLGESGCGTTSFKEWASNEATRRQVPVLHLHGALHVHGPFGKQAADQSPPAQSAERGEPPVNPGAGLRESLSAWCAFQPGPKVALISSLERLEESSKSKKEARIQGQMGELRGLLEEPVAEGLAVYLLARDPSSLLSGPFSTLRSLATIYRLGWFSPADLTRAWTGPDAERVAAACYEWTGGQPLLSRLFLQLVAEAGPRWDGENIGYGLVDRPPHQQYAWTSALTRQLAEAPVLLSTVQSTMNGNTLDLPHREMSALYLSGWLTPTRGPKGEWGMPRCFQEWAREVVREVGR